MIQVKRPRAPALTLFINCDVIALRERERREREDIYSHETKTDVSILNLV